MEEQREEFSGPAESYSFEVRVETNMKLVSFSTFHLCSLFIILNTIGCSSQCAEQASFLFKFSHFGLISVYAESQKSRHGMRIMMIQFKARVFILRILNIL